MDGRSIQVKETEEELKTKLRECDRLWQKKFLTSLLIIKADGFVSWNELRRSLQSRLGSSSIVSTLQGWLERYQEKGISDALRRESKKFFDPRGISETGAALLRMLRDEKDEQVQPVIHALYLVKSGGVSSWAQLSKILKSKYPTSGDFHSRIVRGWLERSKDIGAGELLDVKRLGISGTSIKRLNRVNASEQCLKSALEKNQGDSYYAKVITSLMNLNEFQLLRVAAPESGVSVPTLAIWRDAANAAIASSKTEDLGIEKFLNSLPYRGKRVVPKKKKDKK